MRLFVTEIVPGVSVFAVILTHGSPLSFAEVRAPLFPGRFEIAGFFQSFLFHVHCGFLSGFAMRFLQVIKFFFGLPCAKSHQSCIGNNHNRPAANKNAAKPSARTARRIQGASNSDAVPPQNSAEASKTVIST